MSDDLYINPEYVESIHQSWSDSPVFVTMRSGVRHEFHDFAIKQIMYRLLGRNDDGSFFFEKEN
jgi:hypothetical protein